MPISSCSPSTRRAGLSDGLGDRSGNGRSDKLVKDARDDVALGVLSSGITPAIARAVSFNSSLISPARTSREPRKMPGKQRTLLIWF